MLNKQYLILLQLNSQYEKILIFIKPTLGKSSLILVPKLFKIIEIFVAKILT